MKLNIDGGPSSLNLIHLQKKGDQWQPVACASGTLTDPKKRYSQLEKEVLAIRWACERCYMYLIGSLLWKPITSL